VSDPFGAVLARNTLLGLVLGALLATILPRSGALGRDYLDAVTVGLCFAFLGYAAERALALVPGIRTGGGRLVRVAGWFAAGLWAYLAGRVLWRLYGRDTADLPPLVWGGVFLVAVELVLHGGLALRGRSDFFGRVPM